MIFMMKIFIGLILVELINFGRPAFINCIKPYLPKAIVSSLWMTDAEEEAMLELLYPDSKWIRPSLIRKEANREILKENLKDKIKFENNTTKWEIITTEDLESKVNIILDLPQEYNSYKEEIVKSVQVAILKLYSNDCFINTDNIRISITNDTRKTASLVCYVPRDNLIEFNFGKFKNAINNLGAKDFKDKNELDFLTSIILHRLIESSVTHELMHKYSHNNLGYLPLWLNEGFSTQFDKPSVNLEDLPKVDLEKNFSYINNYPSNKAEKSNFYDFNKEFIRLWLNKNNTTLGKLIKSLQPLVEGKGQEEANVILRNYLIEHGGKEILEERGFKIPESWGLGQTTIKAVEFKDKQNQELKPKAE